MILLDTNVISEAMRERPNPAVRAWLKAQPRAEIWTASVVIAELLSGIESMPAGRKQGLLREMIEDMIAEDFRGVLLCGDARLPRRHIESELFRVAPEHRERARHGRVEKIAPFVLAGVDAIVHFPEFSLVVRARRGEVRSE